MVDIALVNAQLRQLVSAGNFEKVLSQATSTSTTVQALDSTSLGTVINEIVSGFQALNVAQGNQGSALMTNNVPGVTLENDTSANNTSLGTITGGTVNNGFTKLVVTTPTPEGIKSALAATTTVTNTQLKNVLENLIADEYATNLDDVVTTDFSTEAETLAAATGVFTSSVNNLLGGLTGNLIQDIILKVNQAPLVPLVQLGVDIGIAQQAYNLILEDKKLEAAKLIFANQENPTSITQIEDQLEDIDTSISNQVETGAAPNAERSTYDTNSNSNKWTGASTPPSVFTYVSSEEELRIEFLRTQREITQMMFFGYEVEANQVLTSADIHLLEGFDTGGDGITMHYIVLPNGTIQRGRPISKVSSGISEHNDFSVFIGSIINKDSNIVTVDQLRSIKSLSKAFYAAVPGGQMLSSNDFDPEYTASGFKVDSLVRANGKQNFGNSSRSFSSAQLAAAAKNYQQNIES